MADSTDVCNAIANAVNAIVQPLVGETFEIVEAVDAEAYGEQTVPPITVMLSRPLQKDLEDRLAASKGMISVEPDENDANTEQYANEGNRQDLISQDPVTLVATAAPSIGPGFTWTLSGPVTPGNIIGVQSGLIGATYVVVEGDTLASIAAALAASCTEAGAPTTSSGARFTVAPTAGGYPTVALGAPSTWLRAVSRIARHFDVMFWLPDPYIRQYLVKACDPVYRPGQKLVMPDGSQATIRSKIGTLTTATRTSDEAARDNLFLARTRWLIEYTVTETVTKAPVVAITASLDAVAPNPSSQL